MKLLSRYRGGLLGLAVGDALGTTLEFSPPGTFTPISDVIGGGPFCGKRELSSALSINRYQFT